MIKLFNSTDLTFDSNGDKIINATKAIVHKEDWILNVIYLT